MMSSALISGQDANTFDFLMPMLRGLASLFIACSGTMLFAMIGSLAMPVFGAIVGGFVGLLFSLALGCCLTGFWRDMIPDDAKSYGVGSVLPHSVAAQMGTHGSFDLIVTVHECHNVDVVQRMPWRQPDIFIELECGHNPIKRTCVRKDQKFNEQFKVQIKAADDTLLIRLKDQDIFGATNVGYCCINVQQDILNQGFPWQKRFNVLAGEKDQLRWSADKPQIIISFDYTDEYPQSLRQDDSTSLETRKQVEAQWQNDSYGAVNFLSRLEFNPNMKIAKASEALKHSAATGMV